MSIKFIPAILLTFVVGIGLSAELASAQDFIPTEPTQQPVQEPVQQPTTGGDTNIGEGGTGVGELGDSIDIETTPDQRNQGFVGATAERILEGGFVGRPGDASGPGVADGGSFGGGVNDSVSSNINISSSGTATGGRGGGFGGVNTGTGVTIQRRNGTLRTRIRPSFYAPKQSPPNGGQSL